MPSIYSQRIYPYLLKFDETYQHNKDLDLERSAGLHVSTIYSDYCVAAGLLKTWDDDADVTGESEWMLHLGLGWEAYMAPRVNLWGTPKQISIWQPGEIHLNLSNGETVYMTPDMHTSNAQWLPFAELSEDVVIVEDFKYTMKKPFTDGVLPEVWLQQAASYLHAYNQMFRRRDHLRFRYWVMHSRGDYRRGKVQEDGGEASTNLPIAYVYWLDYSRRPEEIENTWSKLDGYACRNYSKLLQMQEQKHLARTQAREERRQKWEQDAALHRAAYQKTKP